MANISRKEDLKDLEERSKYGRRLYGRCFPSTDRAVMYNAVHGTNILDDECLDVYLNNTERIELDLNKIRKIEINLNNTRRRRKKC